MSIDNPRLGELLVYDHKDWMELPDTHTPYYVVSKEGMFAHRKTAQGRGLVPTRKMPKLKAHGYDKGHFIFDGKVVPADIYAQAVHFFRRIFEKFHTEAEVIITQHKETEEYRLFVPTQSVAHGGVSSIYNPAHIHPDYLVVGTFHSHCDFGPGHSGIDEGDARDMDGLHGTIGYITRDVPEMALMYALNGNFFHFQMPFDGVVDMNNLAAATAPEWWDRYVIPHALTDADREKVAPYATDDQWDTFMMRRKKPKVKVVRQLPSTTQQSNTRGLIDYPRRMGYYEPNADRMEELAALGYLWDPGERAWMHMGSYISEESMAFNQRLFDPKWGSDGELLPNGATDSAEESDFWEDRLGKRYIDELFDTNLITEADLELAINSAPESATTEYWEKRMRMKLFKAVAWLREQGLTVKVTINDTRIKAVPGQTTMEEQIGATS